ncbi:MAG: hypothetical protein Kow0089_19140 [Desulfobulbaceae bacterium]
MLKHLPMVLRFAGGVTAVLGVYGIVRGGSVDLEFVHLASPLPLLVSSMLLLAAAYMLPEGTVPRATRCVNLCLLIVSLFVSLFVGELGLRQYLQQTQGFNSIQQMYNPNPDGNLPTRSNHPLLVITRFSSDKRLIYELKPDLDMRFGEYELRTNSMGIRADREFSPNKPDGLVRIIGIGDSGMWGWDVHQNQGYLEVLERLLNQGKTGKRYETINLAVPGYNTFQEVTALRLKGLALQPDIVVIGWCYNDFNLPFFMYTRKDHWKQKESYVYNLLFDRTGFQEMITPEVLKYSDILVDRVDPEVIAASGIEGVGKTMEEAVGMAREKGFRIVLFGPLKEDILALAHRAGMPTINTYEIPVTAETRECKVLFMHPLACGHEILGRYLADRLHDLGWL